MNTQTTFTEHRIKNGGGEIFVRDFAGSGDPFVLMHGFPDNHRIYDRLAPLLAASGRRTVVFDFQGFGDSSRAEGGKYSFGQQLDDLRAVVRERDLGRIIPVGHDASGPAALNFAIEHPDAVTKIVLLNSLYAAGPSIRVPELIMLYATASLDALSRAASRDAAQFSWLLKFQQEKFRSALPEPLRERFEEAADIINANFTGERPATEAFIQLSADLFPEVGKNTAQTDRLKGVTVPVSFIWGQYDPYLNTGVVDELLPYLPQAKVDLVSAGHWLQIDRPEDVARLMLG